MTNKDLAVLRACFADQSIQHAMGETVTVEQLDAHEYTSSDKCLDNAGKPVLCEGDEYKAVVLYLTGEKCK